MTTPRLARFLPLSLLSCLALSLTLWAADPPATAPRAADPNTLQIDVSSVLNARVFTTCSNGKVTALKDDVDGAGGVATNAAAKALGNKDFHAMPDDARFPANDRHPEVILNYSNDEAVKPQARRCPGEDSFSFATPSRHYASLCIFASSGWGKASEITVELAYKDGTTDTRELEVPDWYWDLKPDDKDRFYLIQDLGKWSRDNKVLETRHHSIFGLQLRPDPAKLLEKVSIKKTKQALMAFYGATGQIKP